MAYLTVVFDSCVLYSDSLRSLFLHLAVRRLFRARWSEDIHEEWMAHLIKNRPDLDRGKLQRTRAKMDAAIDDCLVTGYGPLVEGLTLPDPDDQHVLAAAIVGRADAIVTFDTGHFPGDVLRSYGIEPLHPDKFLSDLIDFRPQEVCAAFKTQRESLRKPPRSVDERLEFLHKQGLAESVRKLRGMRELL